MIPVTKAPAYTAILIALSVASLSAQTGVETP